jgi:catechol 2,3-dioxygenase-like lactoylglutathione lyase family enzyme
MLKLERVVAFVVTSKPDEAKAFYSAKLGFRFLRDDEFALVFDAHGVMLRIAKMQKFTPAQNTVLGWEVENIAKAVQELAAKGVQFEQYDFMHPDQQGIVTFPTGDKVAWFKDPDGNVLSVSQHVSAGASVGH